MSWGTEPETGWRATDKLLFFCFVFFFTRFNDSEESIKNWHPYPIKLLIRRKAFTTQGQTHTL